MATVTDFLCVSDQVTSKRKRSPDRSNALTTKTKKKMTTRRCCSSSLHPAVGADGNCVICRSRTMGEQEHGKIDGDNGFIPFYYVQTGLKIRQCFLAPVRKVATERLLEQKKLVLVLDIDHTLLHSTVDHDNVGEDKARDVHMFSSTGKTKLRPLVRSFLKLVSPMYEMYLYTQGKLRYAKNIKKIIDPDDFYFKNKVIAREDSVRMVSEKKTKHMDLVLAETNLIVVIDDKPSMWIDHPRNVVHIKKYEFPPFVYNTDCGGDQEDDDGDDILLHMYLLLNRIYSQFYDSIGCETEDVREVMRIIRRETLKDCKIIIIGDDESGSCGQLVETMGGSCYKEISDEVTHVVVVVGSSVASVESNQDATVNWAVENGKFVVSKDWLDSAYYTWTKPQENKFTFSSSPPSPSPSPSPSSRIRPLALD